MGCSSTRVRVASRHSPFTIERCASCAQIRGCRLSWELDPVSWAERCTSTLVDLLCACSLRCRCALTRWAGMLLSKGRARWAIMVRRAGGELKCTLKAVGASITLGACLFASLGLIRAWRALDFVWDLGWASVTSWACCSCRCSRFGACNAKVASRTSTARLSLTRCATVGASGASQAGSCVDRTDCGLDCARWTSCGTGSPRATVVTRWAEPEVL